MMIVVQMLSIGGVAKGRIHYLYWNERLPYTSVRGMYILQ
jgi:hypothetical protein